MEEEFIKIKNSSESSKVRLYGLKSRIKELKLLKEFLKKEV